MKRERARTPCDLAEYHLVARQLRAVERTAKRREADELVALSFPSGEEPLERARELPTLELCVRREDVRPCRF